MPRLSKVKKHRSKRKHTKKQRGGAGHLARAAARAAHALPTAMRSARAAVKNSSDTLGKRAGKALSNAVVQAGPKLQRFGVSLFEPKPSLANTSRAGEVQSAAVNEALKYFRANPNLARSQLQNFSVAPNHAQSTLAQQIQAAFAHG